MIKHLLTILPVVFACIAQAQNTMPASLQKQFTDYSISHLQEKVFVQTDRNFYTAGDNIWFKIYLADGILHQPLDLSKIVYAELISAEHKPFLQAKIIMSGGMGSGSFSIPYSVPTGNYLLRCYTSLMKNYSADYFFYKQITIANTFKALPWNKPDTTASFDVQFFPEGGNLVAGLSNNVGFKITGSNGESIDATGVILNNKNDTVCTFSTFKFGMGHFNIIPENGVDYHAIIFTEQGENFHAPFPASGIKGYTLQLKETVNHEINLSIASNETKVETVFLLIQTRQSFKKIIAATTNKGSANFSISKNDLGEGISTFTIFNAAKTPLCERLYFRTPGKRLIVKAITNQQLYGTRQPVNVEINTSSNNGVVVAANLSMAVALNDSLNNADENHILSYLWLSADLRGHVEHADYYFSDSSTTVNEAADNLMLTQGWRKFNWKEITDASTVLPYIAEADGHIITSSINSKSDRQPIQNKTAFVSFPGRSFKTAIGVSNAAGKLYFDASPSAGSNEIIVQPATSDSMVSIDVETPFISANSSRIVSPLLLSPSSSNQLIERSLSVQVQHVFNTADKEGYKLNNEYDTAAFYGKSGVSYLLDDYTRFTTMEEVLREYVKEVKLRKTKDKFFLDVKSPGTESGFVADPLILLDGVPVHDIDKLIAFDPLKLKRIDVIPEKYYFGAQVNDGIISFLTYEGDLAGFNADATATIVEYEGMQLEKQFYAPRYITNEETQSRKPDFRQLLHWAPYLNTNSTGNANTSFYTSDVKGNYSVIIQGITKEGLAGYTLTTFTVR